MTIKGRKAAQRRAEKAAQRREKARMDSLAPLICKHDRSLDECEDCADEARSKNISLGLLHRLEKQEEARQQRGSLPPEFKDPEHLLKLIGAIAVVAGIIYILGGA